MFKGIALLALLFGYKTFIEASKEKDQNHKTFGRAVSVLVITVSLAMIFMAGLRFVANSICYKRSSCSMTSGMCK